MKRFVRLGKDDDAFKNQEKSRNFKSFSSLFLQFLMEGWGAVWLQVKRGVIFYSLAAAAVI